MKIIDILFAIICGRIISWVAADFLKDFGVEIGMYYTLLLWLAFPTLAVFCLWAAYNIGKKFLFVFQAAKHLLVGAATTVIDLKIFELLFWLLLPAIFLPAVVIKAASFLLSTLLKYWGNKHWAFSRREREEVRKEILQFFGVTIVGLLLDVAAFYYFTAVLGSQFNMPAALWVKTSVLTAAFVAAAWNFLGYKFIVFKK